MNEYLVQNSFNIAVRGNKKSLDLSKCDLTSEDLKTLIPRILKELPGLRELKLRENKLATIPPEIGKLTSLETLNLSANKITDLPPEIEQLTSLETLNLSANRLNSFQPEIARLINLQILDISHNQLTTIPPEIGQLTDLKKLDLNQNKLKSLSPHICGLTNLQTLDIHGNQLTTIPPEIGQLKHLRKLALMGSGLTALPHEIGQLTELRILYLGENRLTSLPPAIGRLKNLQELSLRQNQLKSLPPEIGGLKNLEELDLFSTGLTSLPPEIGGIRGPLGEFKINLEYNKLTALPREILYINMFVNREIVLLKGNPIWDSKDIGYLLGNESTKTKWLQLKTQDHIDHGARSLPRPIYRLYFDLFVKKDFEKRFYKKYEEDPRVSEWPEVPKNPYPRAIKDILEVIGHVKKGIAKVTRHRNKGNRLQNRDGFNDYGSKVYDPNKNGHDAYVVTQNKLVRPQKIEPSKKSPVNLNKGVRLPRV